MELKSVLDQIHDSIEKYNYAFHVTPFEYPFAFSSKPFTQKDQHIELSTEVAESSECYAIYLFKNGYYVFVVRNKQKLKNVYWKNSRVFVFVYKNETVFEFDIKEQYNIIYVNESIELIEDQLDQWFLIAKVKPKTKQLSN